MFFSRRVKQVIAGTAGMIFLLCYSAGFVQACSTSLRAPEKSEMPPCPMMMGDESGAPSNGTPSISRCHDVASLQLDHPLPDWSPTFVVSVADPFTAPVWEAPPLQPPSLHVKPPPLRILHCCLRN